MALCLFLVCCLVSVFLRCVCFCVRASGVFVSRFVLVSVRAGVCFFGRMFLLGTPHPIRILLANGFRYLPDWSARWMNNEGPLGVPE